MVGHDISQIPCTYCHRNLNDVDALWRLGLPYHDHCDTFAIANELKQYQKKVSLGTITLAEAKRMEELQGDLDIKRVADQREKQPRFFSNKRKPKLLSSSGSPVFFSEERRKLAIEAQKKLLENDGKKQALIEEDKKKAALLGVPLLTYIQKQNQLSEKYNNTFITTGEQLKIGEQE